MMGKRLVAAARKPLSTSGVRKERTWAAHWSSRVGSFRVRGGAGGYGFAACAAPRRCLGGSSYQAQRLEARVPLQHARERVRVVGGEAAPGTPEPPEFPRLSLRPELCGGAPRAVLDSPSGASKDHVTKGIVGFVLLLVTWALFVICCDSIVGFNMFLQLQDHNSLSQ